MTDAPTPRHILGELVHMHDKAIHAASRMHHCRQHRPKYYICGGKYRIAIGKSRWTTAHDKWQEKLGAFCKKHEDIIRWKKVELGP